MMFLDASALLAYLMKDPGEDRVLREIVAGVRMTTVNFAEVASRYVANGASDDQVRALKTRLPFALTPIDEEIALRAGLMIRVTRPAGLSLGDRCCLAAAQVAGQGVLTADRAWASVSKTLNVPVEMIR